MRGAPGVHEAAGALLLKEGATERQPSGAFLRDVEGAAKRRRWLFCRTCRQTVSETSALFSPSGGAPVQVLANPHGRLFEVMTLVSARNLVVVGTPTVEFTWFAGYAWQVAFCGECTVHLGWRFERAGEPAGPPVFFGLLRTELVEADDR